MLTPSFCLHCGNAEFLSAQQLHLPFVCSACGRANGETLKVVSPEESNLPKLSLVDAPFSGGDSQNAADLLSNILALMKEKRLQARQIEQELKNLEYQAGAVGEWLASIERQNEYAQSARTVLDLQYRLFDRLQTLKPGEIDLVDCEAATERSLAGFLAGTFEAFGWTTHCTQKPVPAHCGEEITFIVGNGPMTYPVAAIHLALTGAGFRLYSRVDAEQSNLAPRLHVHRISSIPRFLPAPKARTENQVEYRKSA